MPVVGDDEGTAMKLRLRSRVRALAVVGLGAVLMATGASVASADVADPNPPSAPVSDGGYAPEPVLTVDVLEPICDGDVPYLRYAVAATGLPGSADTVSITWVNPTGDDVVQSGLPLSGRVLWPGAEVDADGNAVDWPGWRLEAGEWVVGDEWDWVRPEVGLEFTVNPTATASVGYPESSPACATPPGGEETPPPPAVTGENPPTATPPGPSLPVTGGQVAGIVAVAGGLLLAGIVAVVVTRRRRTE